jgi:hypothetical protein
LVLTSFLLLKNLLDLDKREYPARSGHYSYQMT